MDARTLTTLYALTCGAALAVAGWPTGVGDPLYVGELNNAFDERAAIAGADDGSVWLAWQAAAARVG